MFEAHHEQTRRGTVVVGGGLAGLAAATYLARGGRDVTLVERAPAIGGRAVTDTIGGYAMNRGVHALYTGGPASDVLAELGARYTSGTPRDVFVMDDRGLHRYPLNPLHLLRTTLLRAGEKREMVGLFMRAGALDPSRYAHTSVADWIARAARGPRMRKLLASTARVNLYSDALDIASADTFIVRLQQVMKHPIHYVDGGWQSLVDELQRIALRSGVRVVTSAGVAGLHVHDGRVRSVRLHDGSEMESSEVLLALPPRDALNLVGQASDVDDSLPIHVACLDLALSKLPTRAHPVVFDLERPLFATVQSQFARLAPGRGAVIHAMKQLDPRTASDARVDQRDLEQFMDQIQPGWRDVVVEQHFLPRMPAAWLLPLASRGGLGARPSHRSSLVSNVFFAGDWVGPRGWLVDASLDSARAAARAILTSGGAERASLVEPAVVQAA